MGKKETIHDIALSISKRVKDEFFNNYTNRAIARCLITTRYSNGREGPTNIPCFLTNNQDIRGRIIKDWTGTGSCYVSGPKETSSLGTPVFKNTPLGEVLTKYYQGTHSYTVKLRPKGTNELEVTIYNKATYNAFGAEAEDLTIRISGDQKTYRYARLSDLIESTAKAQEELERQKEELRRVQAEKQRQEEAERLAREREDEAQRKRLEEEIRKREEEERKIQAEAKRIEEEIQEKTQQVKSLRTFLRTGISLRSQHLLDEYQETAKRSHLFDGCAVVIDGGPGTGKTTTTIQRLKFLLSRQALEGYDNPLTEQQIEYLTDPYEWNQRWLFFSPTDLLLEYLRNNMAQEELIANERNTRTLGRFRNVMMRDYGLFDPSKDGPFKNLKTNDDEVLILRPENVIRSFEQFCIDFIRKSMDKRVALKTDSYKWHSIALSIKATYQNMKVKDLDGLMRLLNALSDRDRSNIKAIDSELRAMLNSESVKVKNAILKDEAAVERITELFEKWRREQIQQYVEDEDDLTTEEEDAENEELLSFSKQEFDAKLFSTIRTLLRRLGLKGIDSKTKLSKSDEEFKNLADKFITPEINVAGIGELAWFTKNFACMCRGLESGLINQIPKIYKAFRKQQIIDKSTDYKLSLLETIIKKDNNKHLHPEEQNLLLGFINNMLNSIYKKSKIRFDGLKNKYVVAYKENVRPVIGIDEATDYSLLDYYFMVSFRHYDFCSITLCGDIMQGLNSKGIKQWSDLKRLILPKMEVANLNISYRQLPTLLDVSKEMYKDDQGEYPTYISNIEKSDDEPQPLLYVSDDEEDKARWIARRIIDIFRTYGSLPSVAIFVGEEVNISAFIERIEDLDMLDGIEIVDCSGGKKLDSKEVVRVFRLSEVKGMEFEAVFFYDIDQAIKNHTAKIMRRYLYVGVSRATSHLAATMTTAQGNESIVKYFIQNSSWG